MADQDPKTPDQGPVPDPHAHKPAPRPDAHTRPGAEARRPDQDEDLGPIPELFGAAGIEAATVVSDDPALREEAIRRGAEAEGLETAQIFGLLVATAVALVVVVVAVAVMVSRTGEVEEQRRLGAMAYPELSDLRAAERQQLEAYGRVDDRYHVPLSQAQALLAAEARALPQPPEREVPQTRRGFNLAYAQGGVPGLVPAPGSPAREDYPGTVLIEVQPEEETPEPTPADVDAPPEEVAPAEAPEPEPDDGGPLE